MMKKIIGVLLLVSLMSLGMIACSAKQQMKTMNESLSGSESKEKGETGNENMQSDMDIKGISELEKIPEFKAKTLTGDEVSNEVFKNSKLTIVNVWGSWCKPCVAELPELEKTYEELSKKGVNVLGILNEPDGNSETIEEIVKEQGVKYTNIYPEGKLKGAVLAQQSFPFVCVVDSDGKIVKILDRESTKEYFIEETEKILNEMK